ncbi:MAG: hypothetical protein FWH26_07495 [Oscillospiraceae bacterium]|nr:hypothetical protein [Oscillospiraceae bacterium]
MIETSKALRLSRRAMSVARALSIGHSIALGCAMAALVLGGVKTLRAFKEE